MWKPNQGKKYIENELDQSLPEDIDQWSIPITVYVRRSSAKVRLKSVMRNPSTGGRISGREIGVHRTMLFDSSIHSFSFVLLDCQILLILILNFQVCHNKFLNLPGIIPWKFCYAMQNYVNVIFIVEQYLSMFWQYNWQWLLIWTFLWQSYEIYV